MFNRGISLTKSPLYARISGLSKNGILGMEKDKLFFTKRSLPPHERVIFVCHCEPRFLSGRSNLASCETMPSMNPLLCGGTYAGSRGSEPVRRKKKKPSSAKCGEENTDEELRNDDGSFDGRDVFGV